MVIGEGMQSLPIASLRFMIPPQFFINGTHIALRFVVIRVVDGCVHVMLECLIILFFIHMFFARFEAFLGLLDAGLADFAGGGAYSNFLFGLWSFGELVYHWMLNKI